MNVKLWILPAFVLLLIGCMEEESPEQTNGEQEETATEDRQEDEIARKEDPKKYTAENVYQWLKDSNLLEGEPESLAEHIQDHPAFFDGISTNDMDIKEFEMFEDAAQFKDEPIASSMKKLFFQSVLDAREPRKDFIKPIITHQNSKTSFTSSEMERLVDLKEPLTPFTI